MLYGKKSILTFAIIGALLYVIYYAVIISPVAPLQSASSKLSSAEIATVLSALPALIVGTVMLFLVDRFISAVIFSSAAAKADDINVSIKNAKSRYLAFIGTYIVRDLILFGILAAVTVFAIAIGVLLVLQLGIIAVIAGLVPFIYVFLRLSLAGAECVVGGKGVADSIKSSWRVTKGSLWYILAIYIVLVLAVGIIDTLLRTVFSLVGQQLIGIFFVTLVTYAEVSTTVLIYKVLEKK